MKIDLTNLLNGSCDNIDIDYSVDFSDFNYGMYNPIKNGVQVKGRLFSKADIVYLDIDVSFVFYGVCDRCAEDVEKEFSFNVSKIIVEQLQNEKDDDDYIIVKNRELDLDELINEEVSLSLPNKILCKEDCKGLCSQCGTNLNVKKCDCKKSIDPRMEALLQLLDEE